MDSITKENKFCKKCQAILSNTKVCDKCGKEQDDYDELLPTAQILSSNAYNIQTTSFINSDENTINNIQGNQQLIEVPPAIEPPKNQFIDILTINNQITAIYNLSLANQNEILLNQKKILKSSESTSFSFAMLHLQTDSLSGTFDVPYKISRFGIASGSKLDFTYARFVTKIVKIKAGKLLGKIKITIPKGVCVEVYHSIRVSKSNPDKYGVYDINKPYPIIQVKGILIAGGVKVIVSNIAPPIQIIGM